MRSRYCAYVRRDADYLRQTWHPDYRPVDLTTAAGPRWLGLEIMQVGGSAYSETVEFEARFLADGKVDAIHERSDFVREQGHWLYTRGDLLPPTFDPWKPGRNETCPCGSGRKFKRCCAGA